MRALEKGLFPFFHLGFYFFFDFFIKGFVFFEGGLGGIPALSKLGPVVAEPATALLDDVVLLGEVYEGAYRGDALVIHDVELSISEGWCHFIFDDFNFSAAAGDGAVGGFNLADAADVNADGGEELQGAATWGGFWATKHDSDFLADLVGKDAGGAGF